MHNDWMAILPLLILAIGGTFVFCAGAFRRHSTTGMLFVPALITTLCFGAASVLVHRSMPSFSGMIDVGDYTRFFNLVFTLITALSLLFVNHYSTARRVACDELYGLILFATLGMTLVAGALHWLVFFLGLELLSISLYVLIAIRKDNSFSAEAGLKYLIMGAVASAFLTFGIAVLYSATGTLHMAQSLAANAGSSNEAEMLLALSLIFVGIGFKISIVPFHLWTPDVYQGSPAPVTAFLATGSKVAIFAMLLRVSVSMAEPVWKYCLPVFWGLAALTMIVGNVSALTQSRVKRLLAYSSVAQIGYLFMALPAVRDHGLEAIMFYLVIYALMDMGVFGVLGTLSPEGNDLDEIDHYRGLGYSHPWRAAVFTVCLLSLAGLPPTGGFMGKFVLFKAVLQSHYVFLAVIGIITVIISIFFYLKVVLSLYMQGTLKPVSILHPSLADRIACALILGFILLLGVLPSPILAAITRIAPSLFFSP